MTDHFHEVRNIIEKELSNFSQSNFLSKISKRFENPNIPALEKNRDCIICLQEMKNDITYLNCPNMEISTRFPFGFSNGHCCHSKCLEKWFQRSKSCPCCRHSFENEFKETTILPVSYVTNAIKNDIDFGANCEMREYLENQENIRKIFIMGGIDILPRIVVNIGTTSSIRRNLSKFFLPEEILHVLLPLISTKYKINVRASACRLICQLGPEIADAFGNGKGMDSLLEVMRDYHSNYTNSYWSSAFNTFGELLITTSLHSKNNMKKFIRQDGIQLFGELLVTENQELKKIVEKTLNKLMNSIYFRKRFERILPECNVV